MIFDCHDTTKGERVGRCDGLAGWCAIVPEKRSYSDMSRNWDEITRQLAESTEDSVSDEAYLNLAGPALKVHHREIPGRLRQRHQRVVFETPDKSDG
jgi:hypothetical protein